MAVPSRFNRDYELIVNNVTVVPPIRIVFRADKTVGGRGRNHMVVSIYNLAPKNRLALVKDAEEAKYIPLSFSVGYKDTLHLIFKGSIHRGQNYREGPDFITELECLDGGFDTLYGFTSRTVKGKQNAIRAVLEDMPHTGVGKLTSQDPLLRPRVLVGPSRKLIEALINDGETWYIDDEKLYITKDDEVVSSFIPVVTAATGLLNTPTREQKIVTFETLMNPTLRINRLCQLRSVSAPHLNGVYKIDTVGYTGDTYGADWKQTVTAIPAGSYSVL